MRAPSFRVTERGDGALILHYYSERKGLEHVVIGMVRTVAKKLHNKDVDIQIISSLSQGKGLSLDGLYLSLTTDSKSTKKVHQYSLPIVIPSWVSENVHFAHRGTRSLMSEIKRSVLSWLPVSTAAHMTKITIGSLICQPVSTAAHMTKITIGSLI